MPHSESGATRRVGLRAIVAALMRNKRLIGLGVVAMER